MNKFRPFLAFLLVGLLLSVPVFADDDTGDASPAVPSFRTLLRPLRRILHPLRTLLRFLRRTFRRIRLL